MRPTAMHHKAVFVIRVDLLLDLLFHAAHFKRREVFSVGHRFQTVLTAANAGEYFHVRVPGRNILVSDRPVNGISISGGSSKFKITPALAGATPHNGFTTNLVAPDPIKRFFLHIRMLCILYKKMMRILAESITLAYDRIVFFYFERVFATVFEIPWVLGSGRIVLDM